MAEFISEAFGLACYYSGTTCYRTVRVVVGSDEFKADACYLPNDNSIYIQKISVMLLRFFTVLFSRGLTVWSQRYCGVRNEVKSLTFL